MELTFSTDQMYGIRYGGNTAVLDPVGGVMLFTTIDTASAFVAASGASYVAVPLPELQTVRVYLESGKSIGGKILFFDPKDMHMDNVRCMPLDVVLQQLPSAPETAS